MKASAAVDIVFNEQQNKFRGLISEFKSHKFVKDRTTHPSVRFRSHLRELLLEARTSLQTSQFDNYLSWINHQIEAQLVGVENSAIGYDELSGIFIHAPISASVISHLRPRLLAMCGICAGVKDKVNYGDVLLADPAWDFQSGKRVRDKENTKFSMSPHHLCAPTFVRTHVEQIRSDKESLAKIALQYSGDLQDAPIPKVVIGPVASGSAVLADGEVINEIKIQHRDLIGVEMEIYGMYAAAHYASKPQPLTFALKAVCDFADPDKEDKYQRYAAYTSANVLRLLMERFGPRLLGW